VTEQCVRVRAPVESAPSAGGNTASVHRWILVARCLGRHVEHVDPEHYRDILRHCCSRLQGLVLLDSPTCCLGSSNTPTGVCGRFPPVPTWVSTPPLLPV
jgi:hypothetical protein